MSSAVLSGGLAACFPASGAASSACAGAGLQPDATNAAAIDAATLCLINRARAGHGMPALRANGALRNVAARQAAGMLRWNYFADVRPSGPTPLSLVLGSSYRAHAARLAVGQNIAWGSGSFDTPAHVVAEWMASPPHRRILLAPAYRDAGIAATPGLPRVLGAGSDGAVYVVEFGARKHASGRS